MDNTGFASPHRLILDNGPEFVAKAVRGWLAELGVTTLFIEPGSPSENGYIESFNGKLRDELLNGEFFYTLKEAQILIANWLRLYTACVPTARWGNARRRPRRSSGHGSHLQTSRHLILTRFRGHLTIGDLGPRRWSPHAEITSTLRT